MCDDIKCPQCVSCYRHTAPIAEYNQSWFVKSPLKEDKTCDEFLMDNRHKILRSKNG